MAHHEKPGKGGELPYSGQSGLLKVEREILAEQQSGAPSQGPGSGQSRAGSGKPSGAVDTNTTVTQYPPGAHDTAPIPTHPGTGTEGYQSHAAAGASSAASQQRDQFGRFAGSGGKS